MDAVVAVLLVLLALASTLGAGLDLDPARLRVGRREAWRLTMLVLANAVAIPLATIALLEALPMEDEVRRALVLVAFAPGGASAPLLATLAGGDPARIALDYTILAVLSALLVGGVWPLWGAPSAVGGLQLAAVVALQLVPLSAGALLAVKRPAMALRLVRPLQTSGKALLVGVIGVLLVSRGGFVWTLGPTTMVALAGSVGVTVGVGAAMAPSHRAAAAALACVRNLTLALMVAEAQAPGGRGTLVIAAYGLVMYGAAWLLTLPGRGRRSGIDRLFGSGKSQREGG